jgi:hypothetical protein
VSEGQALIIFFPFYFEFQKENISDYFIQFLDGNFLLSYPPFLSINSYLSHYLIHQRKSKLIY